MTPKKQPNWKVIGAASLAALAALFVILILEIIILKPFGGGKKAKEAEASSVTEAAEDAIRNVFPSDNSGSPAASTPSVPGSASPSVPEINTRDSSSFEQQLSGAPFALSGDTAVVMRSDGGIAVFGSPMGDDGMLQLQGAVAVDGGMFHVAGLKADGTVVAYGNANQGQCNVAGWRDITAIDCGYAMTAGVKKDGTVVVCGTYAYDKEVCTSPNWTGIVSVSAGYEHIVGLRSDGTVVAIADSGASERMLDVSGWRDIVQVAAGREYTAGLRADGTVVIAGADYSAISKEAPLWTDIVKIAAGDLHLWGLHADGTMEACGFNDDGECDVYGWTDVVDMATSFYYGMAVRYDGTVLYTGERQYMIDGIDATGNAAVPEQSLRRYDGTAAEALKAEYAKHSRVEYLVCGGEHVVGICYDGTVVAAGKNGHGECDIEGWTDITYIGAGNGFTIGVRADGSVVAAGDNSYGQCNVEDWSDIVYVMCGAYHTVGLRRDGTVFATGRNTEGQCNVSGWTGIKQIACGAYHTVGVTADFTVASTGSDDHGQCSGTAGWTNVKSINCGTYVTMCYDDAGIVYATDYQDVVEEWNSLGVGTDIHCINGGVNDFVCVTYDGIVHLMASYVPGELKCWSNIRDCARVDDCMIMVDNDDKIHTFGSDYDGVRKSGRWSLFAG